MQKRVALRITVFFTLAAIGACGLGDSSCSRPTTTVTSAATSTSRIATTTSTTHPTSTTVPTNVRQGDSGEQVSVIQARLLELGYWLDAPDGVFGAETYHAVVVLQKAAGLERTGVVGPATRGALHDGVQPHRRSDTGRVVEIALNRQLLLVVQDGRVEATFDTSTGSAPGATPAGHWQITREIDGFRRSQLGLLYRPKYFH